MTSWNDRGQRWAMLPLRLMVGYGFIVHGFAKASRGPEKFGNMLHTIGVPFPGPTAWVVTSLELIGGLAIIVGAFVVIASIPLIISMLVAMLRIHVHYGFSSINTIGLTPNGPVFGPPGYEINLLYIAALITLALSAPSALSIDAVRATRRNRSLRSVGK